MLDYPIEKTREHTLTTSMTSGWYNDVFVFRLHEEGYNSGQYAVELIDVYRYSSAIKAHSRKAMVLDALRSFTNHQVYDHPTVHVEKSTEGKEWVDYGYTGFSNSDQFGGKSFSSFRHRVIALATLNPVVSPAMITTADEYAKSLIKEADD